MPDVEGGILPPGTYSGFCQRTEHGPAIVAAGLEAGSTAGTDACRHTLDIRVTPRSAIAGKLTVERSNL